jgi:hypothetical protein
MRCVLLGGVFVFVCVCVLYVLCVCVCLNDDVTLGVYYSINGYYFMVVVYHRPTRKIWLLFFARRTSVV